jgi:hypothetical protein
MAVLSTRRQSTMVGRGHLKPSRHTTSGRITSKRRKMSGGGRWRACEMSVTLTNLGVA